MRTIRLIRPARMKAAALKLQVELDGNKAGKLANRSELTLEMDENAHELHMRGGLLASKDFCASLIVPAGSYSYCFQIDVIDFKTSGNYKPILRPCAGEPLKEDTRLRSLIGAASTLVLLDPKVRSALSQEDTRIQLRLEIDSWNLALVTGQQRTVIFSQPYSSRGGSLLSAAVGSMERLSVDTPEHREETIRHTFTEYLDLLPDYEHATEDSLRLRG